MIFLVKYFTSLRNELKRSVTVLASYFSSSSSKPSVAFNVVRYLLSECSLTVSSPSKLEIEICHEGLNDFIRIKQLQFEALVRRFKLNTADEDV